MSNSTVGAVAKAPAKAPVQAGATSPVGPLAAVPNSFAAPPGVEAFVAVAKRQASLSISWIAIAGILAAFVILAAIAVAYFCYKRNAYKKALQEQRNFYMQNAANHIREDWSTDEEQNRNGKSKRAFHSARDSVTKSDERIVDIPAYNPKARRSREKIIPGSFRDKHMTNPSHQGEVFYTGEEGSQMGVRYSREELGNIEILTRVPTPARPKHKRKAESDSTSLLGSLSRSHTIAASPTKETSLGRWKLRTFSLPSYHRKSSRDLAASWDPKGERKIEDRKLVSPLPTHLISSLPASPSVHTNLAPAPNPKQPSRLSYPSFHHPTFVVPPSTPPPPLPLPVTLDTEGPEKTLQELRRAMKQAESKWTIESYFPAPPPPPLPVPFRAPASPLPPPSPPPPPPPPLRGIPPFPNANCNPDPPSFRDLVDGAGTPPPPPPPPPRRTVTLPAKRLFGPAAAAPPPPPPPPPTPPPSSPSSRKATPPPSPLASPPKLKTPPASPPPPALPAGGVSSNGLSRPKLTPLMLPGRPDLATNLEECQAEQRLCKRQQQKMRPLHWDKLKPDSRTVWDKMSDSMDLDEEMIENLFGMSSRDNASNAKRFAASSPASQKNEILDPRKAHNIAIQLRARGLSRVEVCDALLEGDGLGQETLELLVKMSPTEEEVAKFQDYKGDATLLGPADRFILGILQIPSSFERLDAMLYRASFKEELQNIRETIRALEMACQELKGSRTFTKLLEVVLKTGNRLNTGTFRGDAKAFKLDTLLKLADVKGTDGKTTLLHFVIQEIIKAEGARAARLAGFHDTVTTPTSTSASSACTTPTSASSPSSSPLSHFARSMEAEMERRASSQHHDDDNNSRDDFRKIGMDVVRGIPTELDHVRKVGGLDIVALGLAVTRLHDGLEGMKATLEKVRVSREDMGVRDRITTTTAAFELADDVFRETMVAFVADAEAEVGVVQCDLEIVLASVKDISIYFYGEADTAKSTQPLKVFVVMREFLAMLEQACRDVMKTRAAASLAQLPSSKRLSLTPPPSAK